MSGYEKAVDKFGMHVKVNSLNSLEILDWLISV
jgi:hypothetical protein